MPGIVCFKMVNFMLCEFPLKNKRWGSGCYSDTLRAPRESVPWESLGDTPHVRHVLVRGCHSVLCGHLCRADNTRGRHRTWLSDSSWGDRIPKHLRPGGSVYLTQVGSGHDCATITVSLSRSEGQLRGWTHRACIGASYM